MGHTDGVLFAVDNKDLVYIDLAVLKYIDDSIPNKLYWDDGIQITIDKNFIIDLFLALKIDFHPNHLRVMRDFPSNEVCFKKEKGCPGWFRMTIPKKD